MNKKYHAEVCRVSAGYVVRVTVYSRFLFFWWRADERSFLDTDLKQVMLWDRPDSVLSYCVHKTKEAAEKALAEARRDFLTDKKVVISKMETVQTIPKITPMK